MSKNMNNMVDLMVDTLDWPVWVDWCQYMKPFIVDNIKPNIMAICTDHACKGSTAQHMLDICTHSRANDYRWPETVG